MTKPAGRRDGALVRGRRGRAGHVGRRRTPEPRAFMVCCVGVSPSRACRVAAGGMPTTPAHDPRQGLGHRTRALLRHRDVRGDHRRARPRAGAWCFIAIPRGVRPAPLVRVERAGAASSIAARAGCRSGRRASSPAGWTAHAGTERLASGDYAHRVLDEHDDELAQLALVQRHGRVMQSRARASRKTTRPRGQQPPAPRASNSRTSSSPTVA